MGLKFKRRYPSFLATYIGLVFVLIIGRVKPRQNNRCGTSLLLFVILWFLAVLLILKLLPFQFAVLIRVVRPGRLLSRRLTVGVSCLRFRFRFSGMVVALKFSRFRSVRHCLVLILFLRLRTRRGQARFVARLVKLGMIILVSYFITAMFRIQRR